MSVTLTITVSDHDAMVLDTLAFLHSFRGRSPRASMVRETIRDLARQSYANNPEVRDLVDILAEARAESQQRHPSRRLRLVQGGAS